MGNLRPDLYIAAIGRSGSTMLCNTLTRAPEQIIFIEPKFHTPPYRALLAPQLAQYGFEISPAAEQQAEGLGPAARLSHLLGPHLRPIKWGFKEVQCSEHQRVLDLFAPKHILINVRHIFNVALSFMEKHRRQGNEDRFPPAWVQDYCLRESRGLVQFCEALTKRGQSYTIVRYEDFTQDPACRAALEQTLGWRFGENANQFLEGFNRGFEAQRHQDRPFREPTLAERGLPEDLVKHAQEIEALCADYQRFFGYLPLEGPAR